MLTILLVIITAILSPIIWHHRDWIYAFTVGPWQMLFDDNGGPGGLGILMGFLLCLIQLGVIAALSVVVALIYHFHS